MHRLICEAGSSSMVDGGRIELAQNIGFKKTLETQTFNVRVSRPGSQRTSSFSRRVSTAPAVIRRVCQNHGICVWGSLPQVRSCFGRVKEGHGPSIFALRISLPEAEIHFIPCLIHDLASYTWTRISLFITSFLVSQFLCLILSQESACSESQVRSKMPG